MIQFLEVSPDDIYATVFDKPVKELVHINIGMQYRGRKITCVLVMRSKLIVVTFLGGCVYSGVFLT